MFQVFFQIFLIVQNLAVRAEKTAALFSTCVLFKMQAHGKPLETDREMFAPAFKGDYFFPSQPVLVDFAVSAHRNNHFALEFFNGFF